jgi:tellurite resistance protein
MTPAQKNMLIGGGICLVGVAVTVVTYQAAKGGGTYTVAYGAIGVGAIQFLYGLFKFFGERDQPSTDSSPAMLALHAMAYVASGDGKISESEIDAMNIILQRIAGSPLPEGAADHLGRFGSLAPDEAVAFHNARTRLSQGQREIILQCALMVALSDGEIAGVGKERLSRVASALGLSSQDVQVVVHGITSKLDKSAEGQAQASG